MKRAEEEEKQPQEHTLEEEPYTEATFERRCNAIQPKQTGIDYHGDRRSQDNHMRASAFERRNPRVDETRVDREWKKFRINGMVSSTAKLVYIQLESKGASASLRYYFMLLSSASLIESLLPELQLKIMNHLTIPKLREFCKVSRFIHSTCMRYKVHSPTMTWVAPGLLKSTYIEGIIKCVPSGDPDCMGLLFADGRFAVLKMGQNAGLHFVKGDYIDCAGNFRSYPFALVDASGALYSSRGIRYPSFYADIKPIVGLVNPIVQIDSHDQKLSILFESGEWGVYDTYGDTILILYADTSKHSEKYIRLPYQSCLAAQTREDIDANSVVMLAHSLALVRAVDTGSGISMNINGETFNVVEYSLSKLAVVSRENDTEIRVYLECNLDQIDGIRYQSKIIPDARGVPESLVRVVTFDTFYRVTTRSGKCFTIQHDIPATLVGPPSKPPRLGLKLYAWYRYHAQFHFIYEPGTADGSNPASKDAHCVVCRQISVDPLVDIHTGAAFCSEECSK